MKICGDYLSMHVFGQLINRSPKRRMWHLFLPTNRQALDLTALKKGPFRQTTNSRTNSDIRVYKLFITNKKNMLPIGVNTFLLTSPFTNESIDIIRQFKDWGCDTIEIALEDASHIDPNLIKQALDDNGLRCSSICAAMGPGRDLRGNEAEQQQAIDYISQVLDVMTVLDCPVMVGPLYSTVGRAEQTAEDAYNAQWDIVVKHLKRSEERRVGTECG